jgi:putative redox protein
MELQTQNVRDSMTTARVKWIEGMTMLGVDDKGGSLVMSSGDGPGVSPMQMLLLGLGGCAMIGIVGILQKQHEPLQDIEVVVDGERGAEYPKPWQRMHMHYIVTGTGLDPHKVERAINLSVEKYCGVHATLSGVTKITHDFEIRDK